MAADRPQHRIAKLLARAGVASRREVERMIEEGRVAKDDVVIDTPATLLTSLHGVTVDGSPVTEPAPARLFLFHKPVGVLTTERDPQGRPTIYDRLPKDLPRLVPVGRLDLNTEGLLLLTTDGGLKRQLELPATGVERAYRARVYGAVSQEQLEQLIEGIEIEGIRYGSIDANLERRTGANTWVEMILTEGKNREVRRVLEYLGLQVNRLIRTRYGPFILGDLPVGGVGEVRVADLVAFRQSLKNGRSVDPVSVTVGAPARRERSPAPPKLATSDRPARATPTTPRATGRRSGAARPDTNPRARAEGPRNPDARTAVPTARTTGPRTRSAHADVNPRPRAEGSRAADARVAQPTARTTGSRTGPARPDPNPRERGDKPRNPDGRATARAATTRTANPRGANAPNTRKPDPRATKQRPQNPRAAAEAAAEITPTARPARPPARKKGWAKPKPPSGPARPKKPRR